MMFQIFNWLASPKKAFVEFSILACMLVFVPTVNLWDTIGGQPGTSQRMQHWSWSCQGLGGGGEDTYWMTVRSILEVHIGPYRSIYLEKKTV